MKLFAPRPKLRYWMAELKFSKAGNTFEYSACVMGSPGVMEWGKSGADKIIILAGNAAEYPQDERNQARSLTRRLVNTLNDCEWEAHVRQTRPASLVLR